MDNHCAGFTFNSNFDSGNLAKVEEVTQNTGEYSCLKEDQAKYLKDLKLNQDGLLKTQEELKSLQKINSNLTFEMNSSQDTIRNLRSEIRRLRIQDRKKSNENTFDVKKERKNQGVQTEYSCLKEDQAKYLKDLKLNQDGLLKTQEELKSLQKINSNLTFEMNSSQDTIRNLRSEIRRLRIQDRKKSNENTFDVKKERKNQGVQTEYSSYDQEIIIAELKESLHKSNSRITTLEIQIQNEDFPNLKRAKLCDISLTQAKDRIKYLETLLMETLQSTVT